MKNYANDYEQFEENYTPSVEKNRKRKGNQDSFITPKPKKQNKKWKQTN